MSNAAFPSFPIQMFEEHERVPAPYIVPIQELPRIGLVINDTLPDLEASLPSAVVRYSPHSLDSKLAAVILAQWLHWTHRVKVVPYDHQSPMKEFGDIEYLVGVDILRDDAQLIADHFHEVVKKQREDAKNEGHPIPEEDENARPWYFGTQAMSIRNAKRKAERATGELFNHVLSPQEDEVLADPGLSAFTNSNSWLVINWLAAQHVGRTELWDYALDVARFTNLKLVDTYTKYTGVGQRTQPEPELRVPMGMARLASLNWLLDRVIAGNDYSPDATYLRVTADTNAQIARTRQLRAAAAKNLRMETYTHGPNLARVGTMAVNEVDAQEMLYQCAMSATSLITYEDVQAHRIWRVWAREPRVQQFLVDSFSKSATAVWREGVMRYVATALPSAQPK